MVNYTCERCSKEYEHKGNYVRHISRKIPCIKIDKPNIDKRIISEIDGHICSFCDSKFKKKEKLEEHYNKCPHRKSITKIKKLQELMNSNKSYSNDNSIKIFKIDQMLDIMKTNYNKHRREEHLILNKERRKLKTKIKNVEKYAEKLKIIINNEKGKNIECRTNDRTILQNMIKTDTNILQNMIEIDKNKLQKMIKNDTNMLEKLIKNDRSELHDVIKTQGDEINKFKYLVISSIIIIMILAILIISKIR